MLFCGAQNDDINRSDIFQSFHEITKPETLHYTNLDQTIETVEDHLIVNHGGYDAKDTGPEALIKQPLLNNISSLELDLITQNIELLDFSTGTKIIALGQETDGIFLLLIGKVQIALGNGKYLGSVGAGTCFGELALISPNEKRQANVIALTHCHCARLSAKSLNRVFVQQSGIRAKMLLNLSSILVERLNKSNGRVALNT
ncbi:MAG: hypothetical protein CBB68_05695 [Rhodospirillaceae bacterium TMED8]|nr:hypothetical protein [Magnetovibrio sp.]OUT51121.1 MAG: hypothetical protein CBB68_05695 [Rhodospirillaceae bacterium TMED8]